MSAAAARARGPGGGFEGAQARMLESSQEIPRRAGLTVLELSVYTGLFLLVGSQLLQLASASGRAVGEVDAVGKIAERNRAVLYRVAQELRGAIGASAAVLDSGKTLRFQLASGFEDGAVVPGHRVEYRIALAPGELQNSLDDNGNGLRDEGQLSRRDLDTAEEFPVCTGLDLPSSGFSLAGAAVTVSFANVSHVAATDSDLSVSRAVTVKPRN